MVLNRLAAILFFSGPLVYVGLLLAVDPTGVAAVTQWLFVLVRKSVRGEEDVVPEHREVSWPAEKAPRAAGVTLILIAVVV
jgi:hypothetical protein